MPLLYAGKDGMSKYHPALVLNADAQPLSYHPLSVWEWEDAVKAVIAERVTVLASYDTVVRSPTYEMQLPSVLMLRQFIDINRPAAFSRWNLSVRDHFKCVYCGSPDDLTFDHVVPRSRLGPMSFSNAVLACLKCNQRKANRTPKEAGMTMRREPYTPTSAQLREIGRKFPPPWVHASWLDYAYWEVPLTEEPAA